MDIRTCEGENYSVRCDAQAATVVFEGSLRLSGPDAYSDINQMLHSRLEQCSNSASEASPEQITLDIQELKFLNSSGISMLSKFVISVRKQENVKIVILASENVPWQSKSLKNLQRLLPSLEIEMK